MAKLLTGHSSKHKNSLYYWNYKRTNEEYKLHWFVCYIVAISMHDCNGEQRKYILSGLVLKYVAKGKLTHAYLWIFVPHKVQEAQSAPKGPNTKPMLTQSQYVSIFHWRLSEPKPSMSICLHWTQHSAHNTFFTPINIGAGWYVSYFTSPPPKVPFW